MAVLWNMHVPMCHIYFLIWHVIISMFLQQSQREYRSLNSDSSANYEWYLNVRLKSLYSGLNGVDKRGNNFYMYNSYIENQAVLNQFYIDCYVSLQLQLK